MRDFPLSQIAGSKRRMGRPPLHLKTTVIRFKAETIARIEALVGKGRMSQFMREAAEAELVRRETGEGAKPRPIKPAKATKVRK